MKVFPILVLVIPLGLSVASGGEVTEQETGDYNFDGHLDYRQQSAHPGNQCGWWDYYLYDPSDGEHHFVATNFCKENFDQERKLVITRISGGMAGLIYAIRHFRWEGFTFIPTYTEKQDYDSNRKLFIRTRVTNIDKLGGPTVVSEILTPEDIDASPELLSIFGIRD